MQTYSINAASLMLERDRRTVTKAMQGVRPDEKVRGQPRWKLRTIVDALERDNRASNGGGGYGSGRLAEIADTLERLCGEADAATKLVKSLPDLDSKQPHSRAAMVLINRIHELFEESDALLLERDPHSLVPYVTGPIVGTMFRELLAAIYGRDVEIDGVEMFPEYCAEQRAAK
jgi:hypothetical protein